MAARQLPGLTSSNFTGTDMTTPPSSLFPVVSPPGQVPWWVIWVSPASALKQGQRQFHVVQSAQQPAQVGGSQFGGLVLQVEGPYPTKAAAEAAVGSSTGTTGIGTGPGSQANQPPTNPLDALSTIGSTLSRLASANLWERVGMVILGIVLISAGVAHITHAIPIATKIAKTAGAAVAA